MFRRLLPMLLCLLFSSCSHHRSSSLHDEPILFVGAGQSNMMLMDLSKDFSTELQRNGYTNFHTLNAAVGGTSLTEWEKGQPIYVELLKKIAEAKRPDELCVLLFWQGENEGRPNGVFADTWGVRFTQIVQDLRADLGQLSMPVVVVQIGGGSPNWPTWSLVKEQQASLSLTNCVMVKSDDLEQIDNVHFVPSAYSVMGERIATAFIDLEDNRNVLAWRSTSLR